MGRARERERETERQRDREREREREKLQSIIGDTPYLSTHELQQCRVHREELDVCIDSGLVEWASLAVELI